VDAVRAPDALLLVARELLVRRAAVLGGIPVLHALIGGRLPGPWPGDGVVTGAVVETLVVAVVRHDRGVLRRRRARGSHQAKSRPETATSARSGPHLRMTEWRAWAQHRCASSRLAPLGNDALRRAAAGSLQERSVEGHRASRKRSFPTFAMETESDWLPPST
jgi:hypothetical protein